ncbi:hypothetical protein D3C81_877500 [compost metagenome]
MRAFLCVVLPVPSRHSGNAALNPLEHLRSPSPGQEPLNRLQANGLQSPHAKVRPACRTQRAAEATPIHTRIE